MNRRALLGLAPAALMLTGCGFEPVYAPGGAGVGPVEVAPIAGRTGYLTRQDLVRRAGLERADAPPRTLLVTLTTTFINANLRRDSFTTRTQMRVEAVWQLIGEGDAPVVQGQVSATVGYDTQDQAMSEITLQADAEERAAGLIGERVWGDLVQAMARRGR